MTETSEDTIASALIAIDLGLGQLTNRTMVTSAEVTDLLLDLRALLTSADDDSPEPVAVAGAL